jgi:hypothetical protein
MSDDRTGTDDKGNNPSEGARGESEAEGPSIEEWRAAPYRHPTEEQKRAFAARMMRHDEEARARAEQARREEQRRRGLQLAAKNARWRVAAAQARKLAMHLTNASELLDGKYGTLCTDEEGRRLTAWIDVLWAAQSRKKRNTLAWYHLACSIEQALQDVADLESSLKDPDVLAQCDPVELAQTFARESELSTLATRVRQRVERHFPDVAVRLQFSLVTAAIDAWRRDRGKWKAFRALGRSAGLSVPEDTAAAFRKENRQRRKRLAAQEARTKHVEVEPVDEGEDAEGEDAEGEDAEGEDAEGEDGDA